MFMASVLLTAACLLVSVAQPVFADDRIDQTRVGSLSLTREYDRSPIANLPFSLWYVASVDESGSYKLAPEFADCGADLNALSLSTEWDATAKNIISWLGVTCRGGALRNRIVVPEWNSSVFPVKARNLPGIGSKYHTGQLPADVEDPNAPNASNSENANEAARTIRSFENWRLHPAACAYAYAYGRRTCSICLHGSLPEQMPKTCICRQLSKYRNHHIERRNGVRRQQQRLTAPFLSIETDTIFPPKHSTQKVPLARLEPRPKT